MDETRKLNEMKPLEEMNVIDDFLFTELMADEEKGIEVCRMILSCVLRREVRNISIRGQKELHGASEKSHGIRMDVYVEENDEDAEDRVSVYDIEPDRKSSEKAELPRRSRYYSAIIDSKIFGPARLYKHLPELVTIFILSYDPFGQNSMYYEAGSVLKSHPDVPYDDGIRRIYLYTEGDLPDRAEADDRKLKNLLRYINESTLENVIDDNTRKLDEIVRNTKAKEDIGIRYMNTWVREEELKRAAHDEGYAEGHAEGVAEERVNTERERKRANDAENDLKATQSNLKATENELKAANEVIANLKTELAEKK